MPSSSGGSGIDAELLLHSIDHNLFGPVRPTFSLSLSQSIVCDKKEVKSVLVPLFIPSLLHTQREKNLKLKMRFKRRRRQLNKSSLEGPTFVFLSLPFRGV